MNTFRLWTKDGWSDPLDLSQIRSRIASGQLSRDTILQALDGREGLASELLADVPPPLPPYSPHVGTPLRVTVIDFDMSFGNMVIFMLKWALAAVPALILLSVLAIAVAIIFSIATAGLFGMHR